MVIKMKLIDSKPKRFFAFGCSFTKHLWPTWSDIVALDLTVDQYFNYGRGGAGNQYIANTIIQADIDHKITKEDLVIICWTNIFRDDRWADGKWITDGNISNLNRDLAKENMSRTIEYLIKDSATIGLAMGFLKEKGCQVHHLSMCDLSHTLDQAQQDLSIAKWIDENDEKHYNLIINKFNSVYSNILPSFYKVVFDNSFKKLIGSAYNYSNDYHPTTLNHLMYIQKVFDEHAFSLETLDSVKSIDGFIQNCYRVTNKNNIVDSLRRANKRFVKRNTTLVV